jgi:hypothetical protein
MNMATSEEPERKDIRRMPFSGIFEPMFRRKVRPPSSE